MTALDYILNGLEAELQLERELGVRLVECDRSVLEPVVVSEPKESIKSLAETKLNSVNSAPYAKDNSSSQALVKPPAVAPAQQETRASKECFDFVFLHERPLSPKGAEMISKITAALKTTSELAPVVYSEPLPEAKIYVVLGAFALRRWFPALKGAPGMWIKDQSDHDILVTYSPEYIPRFGTITPTVEKIKKDMWTSLKAVAQRAAQKK